MPFRRDRMRIRREELGLSQSDLAALIDSNQNQVSRYETTRMPTADTLESIAKALGCSLDWLMGRTESMDEVLRYSDLNLIERAAVWAIRQNRLDDPSRMIFEKLTQQLLERGDIPALDSPEN
jgi:transcriptional regulator with XRE-family HTH domain